MAILAGVCGFACGVGVAVWALSIVREIECEKCTWSPENYSRGEGD